MTNPLELLKTNAISAVNLLAVLDASASDAEKLEEIFDFIGATASRVMEIVPETYTREYADEARRAVEIELHDTTIRAEEAETQLAELGESIKTESARATSAETRVHELEDVISAMDRKHAQRVAEFEKQLENMNRHSDILTEVAVAHKRIAESMRKNENGDYEGAAKKLMTAEKILQKITGKEYHYD